MGKPAGREPSRTRDGGISGAAGPLHTIKVGVDLKHKLEICSSGLSAGCLYWPGVTIRSSADQPKTLQITGKFLSKSYVEFINGEETFHQSKQPPRSSPRPTQRGTWGGVGDAATIPVRMGQSHKHGLLLLNESQTFDRYP